MALVPVDHEENKVALQAGKRVPVELPPLDEDKYGMSEDVWKELRETIQSESKSLRTTGTLSPRRERKPDSELTLANSVAIKKKVEPKLVAYPTDTKNRKMLPNLRTYFEAIAADGQGPERFGGLRALHEAALEVDSRLLWHVETDLERRIRERTEAAQREEKERKERREKLLAEQRKERDPHGVFLEEYQKSQDDIKHGADADQTNLHNIDQAAARQQREEERKEAARKAAQERVAEMKAERERRSEERRKEIQRLQDEEEEMRDQELAANRVRYRFDAVKKEVLQTGDVSKLDTY